MHTKSPPIVARLQALIANMPSNIGLEGGKRKTPIEEFLVVCHSKLSHKSQENGVEEADGRIEEVVRLTPPVAVVKFSAGVTKSLPGYQSVRFDMGVEIPVPIDQIEDGKEIAARWVLQNLKEIVEEV